MVETKIPIAYQKRWDQNNNSIVFFPLAEAYRKSGQTDHAIQLCQHGLTIHPYYWGARVVLARAYLEKNQVDEARSELEKVIETVPYNLMASELLAKIYTDHGDLAKAVERYKVISSFYPEVTTLTENINHIMQVELPRKKQLLKVLEKWLDAIKKSQE